MTPVTITITETEQGIEIAVDHGRPTLDLQANPSLADKVAVTMTALFHDAIGEQPEVISDGKIAVFNA